MKRFLALILCMLILSTSYAYADVYPLVEILPSIAYLTDEELATLIQNAEEEQGRRDAARAEEEAAAKAEAEAAMLEEEEYIERPTVERGSKGDEAKRVQEKLIELGFLAGIADGDFGKKSEAAVVLFQKANGLEETGIADSMTQHVMYSARVINKEAYDNLPIATGDGWEIIKEYYYSTKWDNYYIFILKNTSGYNAEITVNICFYDADNNLIGVSKSSEVACENNQLTYWSFTNDDVPFDHVTVDIAMSEDTYYNDGGQSCIEVTSNVVGKKAIISAKNNGSDAVEFVEYHVLFLDDNGQVVATDWGYLSDDDSEIKPGATEMREASTSKSFSDVRVYAHGRIDK